MTGWLAKGKQGSPCRKTPADAGTGSKNGPGPPKGTRSLGWWAAVRGRWR